MPKTLSAAVKASFTVMERPMIQLRECDVALDKWGKLHVSHRQILLGLVFDTNTRLTSVGTVAEYHAVVLKLLRTKF